MKGDERIRTAARALGTDPAYERRSPQPGDYWRSRDKRDNGLIIEVLDVANGYVRIQRFRKTTVSLRQFHTQYEFLASESRGAVS